MLQIFLERMETPVGQVIIGTDDRKILRVLDFTDYEARMHRLLERQYGEGGFSLTQARGSSPAAAVLGRYFAGELKAIDRLKTANGGTAFQRKVWTELRRIPRGEQRTYQQIAQQVGSPKSVRAVANACGANPTALAVPCHRVVRTDGTLGGYRWGVERKQAILELEQAG